MLDLPEPVEPIIAVTDPGVVLKLMCEITGDFASG